MSGASGAPYEYKSRSIWVFYPWRECTNEKGMRGAKLTRTPFAWHLSLGFAAVQQPASNADAKAS